MVGPAEFIRRESVQAPCARDLNRRNIVVNADALAVEMGEIPPDATTQV
jgi:hypothetical protein